MVVEHFVYFIKIYSDIYIKKIKSDNVSMSSGKQ